MAHSSSSESSRSGSDGDLEPSDPCTHVLPGPYRWEAGFIHVARMSHVQIDTPLISALVERWRPETHTFHMTQGEMTVTLQDVAGILGLPTDGQAVTGSTALDWVDMCQQVFGTAPVTGTDIHGGDLRISYLDKIYADWFTVAHNPEEVRRYTKAHILRLLGSWLVCDRSGGSKIACRYVPLLAGDFTDIGRYSWGSAVLAHLFRHLCVATNPQTVNLGGCHVLLQIWAWIRFPPIAPPIPQPTHPEWHFGHRFNSLPPFKPHEQSWYRANLDTLYRDEVVWQPYGEYHTALFVSDHERYLWLAITPIICFHTVEYAQPDRCMRQFGFDHPIPRRPRKLKGVHDLTL
ncbi:serine/threonine-protein phosphatase 7 long form homolog [Gastrolobium bilobum]|uniref:serine/threonine-protein phosphatase 7 long form homolog n=1 Tax=Gastrolobium bilobum TaxID=150636 RepID=UPI002AAFA7A3|nr:serine/threonine-protein phosphatase 7 long form homolog [Gastrolobium bilobum]